MNLLQLIKQIATHPLNKEAPVQAVSRFLRWQIASRLIREPIALPFVNNFVLITENGMTGATANYYFGLAEQDEMAFALHVLRPGDLFADLGANAGSYSVIASAAGAKVVAVEPLPLTFDRLTRNLRFNGIEAEVHCCGLSAQAGELIFSADADAMNSVVTATYPGSKMTVPVTTLDSLLEGRVPFMIKIDVEGHESQLLNGACATISNPSLQVVLMETVSNGPELIERMADMGFSAHKYDMANRQLKPVHGWQHDTLFLRDPDMILKRCRQAPRFKLVNGII